MMTSSYLRIVVPQSFHTRAVILGYLRVVVALLCVSGLAAQAGESPSGGRDAPGDEPAAEQAVPDTPMTPAVETAEEQRRQNLVSVLLMLLAGVGIVGVAMIAATMIWGGKLRRLARAKTIEPTKQDELWYLKGASATLDSPSQSSASATDEDPDHFEGDRETET